MRLRRLLLRVHGGDGGGSNSHDRLFSDRLSLKQLLDGGGLNSTVNTGWGCWLWQPIVLGGNSMVTAPLSLARRLCNP